MSTATATPITEAPGAPKSPVSLTEAKESPKLKSVEFVVFRSELLRELATTQAAVERKTTIPVLSNFLLEVADGRLTISATDLNLSVRTSCNAKVINPGVCTIPARKFYDYIKLLPDGEVAIKLMDNYWVQIRAGRSRTKMVGLDRGNFPLIPEFPATGALSIPSAIMRHLISHTIFAVSNEESRYTLNGALLLITKDSISMVATDGHRLAIVENKEQTFEALEKEKRTLVPRNALIELVGLLGSSEEDVVQFADDEQTLYFRIGGRVLTSRRLTGQFPNYAAVIPRDNTKAVVIRASDLMASIQRVSQFSDEKSRAVKVKLESNSISLSARSTDSGESEDTIETPYVGEPVTIGFKDAYLIDFLKALGNSGEVRLELKSNTSAAILRPEGGNAAFDFRLVLMPLRVT